MPALRASHSTPLYLLKGNGRVCPHKECTQVFTAVSCVTASDCTQSQCSSPGEWVSNLCYFCTMQYYPTIVRNELLTYTTTWMSKIILKESQSPRKGIQYDSLIQNFRNYKRSVVREHRWVISWSLGEVTKGQEKTFGDEGYVHSRLRRWHTSYQVPFKYMQFTERHSDLQRTVLKKLNKMRCFTKGDGGAMWPLNNLLSNNVILLVPGKGCSITDPKRWHKVAGSLVLGGERVWIKAMQKQNKISFGKNRSTCQRARDLKLGL